MSNKNPKHKKKITEEDLKKHLEERNKKVVEKDNIPTFKPKKKLEDQVVKKDPGTNIHRNKKGEVVIKDEEGVYRPFVRKQTTLSQGNKKTSEEYNKEQEIIKEMQSNDLGLRAPLHYLANPDHMLGDLGNLTGFKPLQNFNNSDKDAKRYNFQSLDPSKSKNERFKNNLNEGLNLVPSAAINLGLATMATRGNLSALKEAYNPIPLPFSTSPKYNVEDQFKYVENQSDTVGLLESQKFLPNLNLKKVYENIATGNSIIPYAWKSPAVGLTQEQSYNIYNKIKGGEKLSEAEKVLLAEYQYNSKPFTGRGNWLDKEKQENLNNLIKNNKSLFPNDVILTRRINPENKELFNIENNKLNLENRPTSFSAGVGIENYGSKANDRIVLSGKNAKQIQNNFLKNNYSEINENTYNNLNNFTNIDDPGFTGKTKIFSNGDKLQPLGDGFVKNLKNTKVEKEIIGTNLNLKRIGKVKNDIGGYDHIMKKFALGGNLQQQTNNNNNMLNEFNEGGSHEQNPLGGIPQGMGQNGQMNTVEEGETKKDSFIYSDRIKLTPELVSQFNLPRVLANKTAAEATKIINTKFEGRNSTIDNSTKKAMLDRIAEAQETVKQVEAQKQAEIAEALNMNSTMAPEDQMNGEIPQGMEEFLPQQQMALGGFSDTLNSMGASGMLGQHTGINQLTTGVDLANTAFGKTGIDTSGATDVNPGSISVGGSTLSGLTKGAQAGAMFGPWGIGIGAAVGGVAGLVGGNRAKKDAMKAHQNFQIGQSNKLVSNFAFGGNLIGEPVVGEPSTVNTNIPITKEKLATVNLKPEEPLVQPTSRNKKMIGLQSGIVNDKKGEGYYYYYDKKPGDPGFNPEEHRDFVTSENHSLGQRYLLSDGKVNPQYNYQLNNYLSQNKGFKYGGNMYNDGGYLNRFKTSRIEDNPNYQAQGPEGFFKTNIPRVGSSLPKKGQFYKESFNQMGQPQISNDLGFNSKLNYNDPDIVSLSPEQLQENNGAVTARTFGPQPNGHYEGEMNNGSKIGNVLNKTGQYLKDNYGNILRYSPVAMNALQLHKLNKSGYDTVNPMINNTRYNPQYMDEKALVNQINAESNYAGNALANSSNGSMGTLRDNILASQLAKTKGLSDAYSRVAEVNRNENKTGQQFNLGVDEANIARRIAAEDKTAMNKGNWETNKSRLLGQIGTDLGNIGKEEVYKKLAKESFGYTWDGKYYVGPKGDKLTRQEMNSKIDSESNQNTTNQNRFGGYILNGPFLNNRMIKRYK